jgi:peptidoglycan/LPS O-acetylase OafA/YrhL
MAIHCLFWNCSGRSNMLETRCASAKKNEFLPRIESLRGIAALMVVGYHVNGQLSDNSPYNAIDAFAFGVFSALANGIGAVVIFFVLSGFVLARSLDGNSDPIRFFRNRFFRLFPAAIAVVALLAALHWQFGIFLGFGASFDPVNVILNMLLIKSDINGVMWSMTVECAATPLILLSVWLFHRRGMVLLWILVAILFGLSFWGSYVHLLGGFTTLAPFYAFVVGVLIHVGGDRFPTRIGPNLATAAAIAAIAVFCFCGTKKQPALILMLECLCATTLITLVAWRPNMKLFKPLDLRLARFYGQISYSFYLLHPLGILVAFRIVDPTAPSPLGVPLFLTAICTTFASILLTTPLAYISYKFIEAPAIKFGRTFDKGQRLCLAK